MTWPSAASESLKSDRRTGRAGPGTRHTAPHHQGPRRGRPCGTGRSEHGETPGRACGVHTGSPGTCNPDDRCGDRYRWAAPPGGHDGQPSRPPTLATTPGRDVDVVRGRPVPEPRIQAVGEIGLGGAVQAVVLTHHRGEHHAATGAADQPGAIRSRNEHSYAGHDTPVLPTGRSMGVVADAGRTLVLADWGPPRVTYRTTSHRPRPAPARTSPGRTGRGSPGRTPPTRSAPDRP
jgi:hypothetical protein